jgi:hypothetical protein
MMHANMINLDDVLLAEAKQVAARTGRERPAAGVVGGRSDRQAPAARLDRSLPLAVE